MKKCPFCAEDIQDAAIKCRFCGSMLSEAAGPTLPVPPSSTILELAVGRAESPPSLPASPQLLQLAAEMDRLTEAERQAELRVQEARSSLTERDRTEPTPDDLLMWGVYGILVAGFALGGFVCVPLLLGLRHLVGFSDYILERGIVLAFLLPLLASKYLYRLGQRFGIWVQRSRKGTLGNQRLRESEDLLAGIRSLIGVATAKTRDLQGAPAGPPLSSPPESPQTPPLPSLTTKGREERVMAAAGVVGTGTFVVLKISGLPFLASVVAGGLVFGVVFRVAQEWLEARALLRDGIPANRAVAIVKVVLPPIGFPLLALFFFFILTSPVSWNVLSREPSSSSSGAPKVASVQKPSEEAVAAAFLEAWKARGLASASALVDPRTPEGAGVVEIYEGLKSYENLRVVGDDSILLRQTGNTIQVRVVAIDAVVKVRGGFGFDAIRLEILVAKDSGRICLVQPLGSR